MGENILPVRGGKEETNGGAEKRRNDSQGGWIVQKFGGTSVGKFAGNIAEDIVRYVVQSLWGGGVAGKKRTEQNFCCCGDTDWGLETGLMWSLVIGRV